MSKSLRLSEKWYQRGLWLIAVIFAFFLVGLGSALVGDLPQVENTLSVETYLDPNVANPVKAAVREAESAGSQADSALDQARLKQEAARANTAAAREAFNNWLATRRATGLPGAQDTELITRTQALDVLIAEERKLKAAVEAQQQIALDAFQAADRERAKLLVLTDAAQIQLNSAMRAQELRIFGYRLALTLPLLAIAGYLFKAKRKSTYWPFVWGFIFFALFAFFVELVPYLPSYGGYVRYIVGILITVLAGRQAIISLNRYLEKQKLAEQQPDLQRRKTLGYDTALARLAKNVCPGCERPVDLKNKEIDFCPHCGIGLFEPCTACSTRNSAFSPYCHACGAPAVSAGTTTEPALLPAAANPA